MVLSHRDTSPSSTAAGFKFGDVHLDLLQFGLLRSGNDGRLSQATVPLPCSFKLHGGQNWLVSFRRSAGPWPARKSSGLIGGLVGIDSVYQALHWALSGISRGADVYCLLVGK